MKKILILIVLCCTLLGCTSTRQYEFTPEQFKEKAVSGDIKLIGRVLRVVKKSGDVKTIKVRNVTATTLIGKNKVIDFEDIRSVELKEVDFTKNFGVAAGIFMLIVQSR